MQKKIKIAFAIILLAAGTILCVVRWQAWFGMPQEPDWTQDTLSYQFHTFAADTLPGFIRTEQGWQDTISPESLDILILGDIHNKLQQADYDSLAERLPNADLIAQAGDWLDRGQFYYHQQLLHEWVPSQLATTPVINCPGNHEYSKGFNKRLFPKWHALFPQPLNGPIDQQGSSYFVDFPQLRFIVIDSTPLKRIVHLTRTLTWLEETIHGAGDRLVVVMMHHPVLSAAEGRFNALIYATFRLALGKIDLALSGHDHNYMRRMPFMVINTAGRQKTGREYKHMSIDYTAEEHVYSVLSIPSNHSPAFLRTYRMKDGKLIDSCYVNHRSNRTIPSTPLR